MATQTVRVVLPPLLRDVVCAVLATEPGVAIVADEPADVVVLADDVIATELGQHDAPRLVIVSADGRRAYQCTACGELSLEVLRDAIRGWRPRT